MHGIVVSEPVVVGNSFTVALGLDKTFKDGAE
jgi:hypothetical protein